MKLLISNYKLKYTIPVSAVAQMVLELWKGRVLQKRQTIEKQTANDAVSFHQIRL